MKKTLLVALAAASFLSSPIVLADDSADEMYHAQLRGGFSIPMKQDAKVSNLHDKYVAGTDTLSLERDNGGFLAIAAGAKVADNFAVQGEFTYYFKSDFKNLAAKVKASGGDADALADVDFKSVIKENIQTLTVNGVFMHDFGQAELHVTLGAGVSHVSVDEFTTTLDTTVQKLTDKEDKKKDTYSSVFVGGIGCAVPVSDDMNLKIVGGYKYAHLAEFKKLKSQLHNISVGVQFGF